MATLKGSACLFLYWTLIPGVPVLAQPPPNPNAQQAAAGMVRMHEAWGSALSTPNASISLKEVSRAGGVVRYRVYANGLPGQSKYVLMNWPVTKLAPVEVARGVTLDRGGLAVCLGTQDPCSNSTNRNGPLEIVVTPVPGEPLRAALVSMDDPRIKAMARIVPIPNEVEDRGCSLSFVLLAPNAALAVVEGRGFGPGKQVTIELASGDESLTSTGRASQDGRYNHAVLPFRKGLQSGTTTVRFKTPECAPSLTFEWGQRR